MVVMFYVALAGTGLLWLITRAPLWRAIEISIDQGLDPEREPGVLR